MSFFHGSPIWYLSPMWFLVSLRMDRASLSSADCPFEEHWLKFTPSIVQKSWRRSSSGSSCRLLIWLKSVMHVLFECPTLFCRYLWGMGPVSVQPSRVLTPYGVPGGPVVNCLEPLLWMHLLQSEFRSGCLWLLEILCSGGESGLCRSHSTFQFELWAFETPTLLLGTQGLWSQDKCCTKLLCRSWHLLF